MASSGGADALLNIGPVLFSGATKFTLIAIPLFILAGAIMNVSGISRRLIAFASSLIGFVKGGLAMVTIATSLFFAEISGSAVADVAALGSILIPAMQRKGYPKAFAAAVMSLGGNAGRHYSAIDSDDSLRRDVGNLGCRVVRCRHRPRRSGRAGHDGRHLPAGAPPQLPRRRSFRTPPRRLNRQGRRLGLTAACHHPWRHLQRLGHGH